MLDVKTKEPINRYLPPHTGAFESYHDQDLTALFSHLEPDSDRLNSTKFFHLP